MQEQLYNPTYEPVKHSDRVVVVEITGMIDAANAEFARQAFYKLEQDKPAAVVLRVESGGGGVTASDQIWHAIQSFRAAHPDVPFVASFGAVAASGGYYISAPADRIFCERTGITGSIGVLAQVPAAGGVIEKLGLEMNMVIADKSPNKDDANDFFVQWYDMVLTNRLGLALISSASTQGVSSFRGYSSPRSTRPPNPHTPMSSLTV